MIRSIPFPMKRRALGSSGLEISEIAFGTGDNGGLMVSGTHEQQLAAVRRALELGVNYFDTAPAYGQGAAETNLGRVLAELGARPIIATKVEIMAEDLDDIEGRIARSLDGSLQRLGIDAVDVLMIHNPPRMRRDPKAAYWHPLTVNDMLGPALAGLRAVRAAGKARVIGFTCESAEPAAAIDVLRSGAYGAINLTYSVVNPSAARKLPPAVTFDAWHEDFDGILTAATELGIGVAAIRPLASGALAPSVVAEGVRARHPLSGGTLTRSPETFRPLAERGHALRFLATPQRTLPQAAYAFILAHPGISTVIGGFSAPEQVEEVARYAGGGPITPDELRRIEMVYERNFRPGGDD